jgi:hypothetical protein
MSDDPKLKEILDSWAAKHGASWTWKDDAQITYTNSRGAWVVDLPDGDRIMVHPTADGAELDKFVQAGHVEVLRVSLDELRTELDGILQWFEGWTAFFAEGPGQGH